MLKAPRRSWFVSLNGIAYQRFWLLVDQAIFAFTNFALNVLFARWLTQIEYGIFALSFSGFLILTMLHYGMVLEPLLMQSAQVDEARRRSYIVAVIKLHAIINAVIIALSIIGWWIALSLDASIPAWGILGVGIGGMMTLTLLTARRLCLVFLSARESAFVGLVYFCGVVVSAYILYSSDHVTWFQLWLVMGAWSLICSAIIFAQLYRTSSGTQPYAIRTFFSVQSRYAAYATAAASAQWFRYDGVLVVVASLIGLAAVADMRAIFYLISPLTHINIALSTSWLVESAQAHVQERRESIWLPALGYGSLVIVVTIVTWMLGPYLIHILYDGRYVTAAWQLPFFCLSAGFSGLESRFTSYLKGHGMLWRGYAPPICGAIIAICASLVLAPWYGAPGAIWAILASYASGACLAVILHWWRPAPID